MIEADLRAYLLEQPAIVALVGNRIHAVEFPPNGATPAVTYQRISGGRDRTHSGQGPARALIQIGCWDETYGDALALAALIGGVLSSHRGPMGTSRWVTGEVVNETDLPEPTVNLNCRAIDVSIQYEA